MRAILASAVILFSAGAWAQSAQNSAVGPDNGFFRPTPGNDPSLTHPRVAVPENPQPFLGQQLPMMVQLPRQAQVPVATPQPAAVVEEQVDKADVEATKAETEAEIAARRAAAQTR